MSKRNAENERVKQRYLVYLTDAKGRDNASVDAAASAIERFEDYNKGRAFRAFHIEQARAFKDHLAAATNARTGKPLSASTIHAVFCDGALDDVDDRRTIRMAMPRNLTARLDFKATQAKQPIVDADLGLLGQSHRCNDVVSDVLRPRGAGFLA
jgi:hypothetical protein